MSNYVEKNEVEEQVLELVEEILILSRHGELTEFGASFGMSVM
jgi:hypothetical protein